MITGEIKNKIDQIWDTFFVAGITNPITVLEQMTYIFFMKMLDDKRTPIADNDIPDVVNRYLHPEAEASRTRKDQSFFVPVEEIRQNDYDLSINKYKEIEREKVEYEPVKDILVRLEENEGKFLKGYRNLCKMLEEDEKKEEMV